MCGGARVAKCEAICLRRYHLVKRVATRISNTHTCEGRETQTYDGRSYRLVKGK